MDIIDKAILVMTSQGVYKLGTYDILVVLCTFNVKTTKILH